MVRIAPLVFVATLVASSCAAQGSNLVVETVGRFEDQAALYGEAKWQLSPDAQTPLSARIDIVAADNCGLVAEGADVQVLAIYSETTVELRVFEATSVPLEPGEKFRDLDGAIWPTVAIAVEPLGNRTITG